MAQRPYAPSWVDRLTTWIDRAVVAPPVVYALAYLAAVLMLHLAAWIDAVVDWGGLEAAFLYDAVWVVLPLSIIHAVDRVAAQAFVRFRSLVTDDEAADLQYRLTTMPFKAVFVLSLLTLPVVTAMYVASPDLLYEGTINPWTRMLVGVVVVWGYSFTPILVYFLVRQLVLVRRAFAVLPEVDVLHQQPLYGLSRVPFATGLGFLVIINLGLFDQQDELFAGTVDATVSASLLVLAFAAFLVPVWGIHGRLRDAKHGLLEDNGRHVELAKGRLYEAVRDGDSEAISSADTAMSSLYRVSDEITKVRTWPWAPGTLRAFMSAVLIPMVVWLLQLFGDRIF